HPLALATPLLLFAVLALTYKRYVWFLVACVLAAACKEDVPLTIALFGILVIWKYKLPRLGSVLIVGGILWSLLAFKVIIPHFYPGAQANNFWYRYEALGSSPGAAIVNVLTHPWLLLTTFITLDRLYYLAGLVRSVGFLPLLAPEWLLPAIPALAENLLSTDPNLFSGVFHYNAAIIPFVMLAAIHGTRRLIQTWQRWQQGEQDIIEEKSGRLSTVGRDRQGLSVQGKGVIGKTFVIEQFRRLVAGLRPRLSRLTLSAWRSEQWQRFSERMVPLAKRVTALRLQLVMFAWITFMIGLNYVIVIPQLNSFWADHEPGSREKQIQQLLALIPPDASVSAGDNLNPHLSERQLLAVFPSVCLDSACNRTVEYVIVDLNSLTIENRAVATSKLNALSRQFRVVARADGVVLLIRRST
ncbi:MAG TPA: DUF2079 domain-containing protein, partial [Ktedonobacteraceae bacterium]|nr:DUF2079 domain-containing protein [Ktedonobacteraceae bacterium]